MSLRMWQWFPKYACKLCVTVSFYQVHCQSALRRFKGLKV